MAIELASPEEEEDLFQNIDDDGEGQTISFRELIDKITTHMDIIFTMPEDQVLFFKEGLQSRKYKDNKKLRDAGIPVANDTLSFLVYPATGKDGKEIPFIVDVRVKLGPRKSVRILEIKIPEGI